MSRSCQPTRDLYRFGAALVLAFVAIVAWAPEALAHTAFESSDPADGSSVDRSVDAITIIFTGASEAAGDGFQVLTPSGEILEPRVEVSQDQRTFTLLLDEPLFDGTVGVRWSVRAGDAHPIEGAFSFTTTTPAPTAPVSPTPTVMPDAATNPDAATASEDLDREGPASAAEISRALEEPAGAVRGQANEQQQAGGGEVASPAPVPVDLDSFLDGDATNGVSVADGVGYIGRAMTFIAALLTVGVSVLTLVAAPDVLRELRDHRWIARAAAVLAIGALLEAGSFVVDGSSGVLNGQVGFAIGLRLLGAIAIAAGCLRQVRALQLAGAGSVLASFTFDGHTVSEGNRIVTGVADVIHTGAAAVWIGGIAILLVMRQSNNPTARNHLPLFAARFSTIATIAIAAVGLTGVTLTVTIVDSLSEIWTTSWGRSLIAKTLFVAGALGLGAYNHFRLVPAVERNEPNAIARLGRVLRIELALLTAVGAVTALLVVGAT